MPIAAYNIAWALQPINIKEGNILLFWTILCETLSRIYVFLNILKTA